MKSHGKWDHWIPRKPLHLLLPLDFQEAFSPVFTFQADVEYSLGNMTSLRGKTWISRSGITPKRSSHRMATEKLNMQTEFRVFSFPLLTMS